MIKIQGNIPRKVSVAFSGGVDSVAVVDFLKRNHELTLLFVNHNTTASAEALEFVQKFAKLNSLELRVHTIGTIKPAGLSKEEWWRNERYSFFHSIDGTVITAHHLNDCIETWVWSSLHGEGKLIPYRNINVIRPFLTTEKAEFRRWCEKNKLEWCEDQSNKDTSYIRNHIRHTMMPDILRVNPGIATTIRKKLLFRGTDV